MEDQSVLAIPRTKGCVFHLAKFNKNLCSYQLTMKDIDALDEDNEGGG